MASEDISGLRIFKIPPVYVMFGLFPLPDTQEYVFLYRDISCIKIPKRRNKHLVTLLKKKKKSLKAKKKKKNLDP